MCKSQYLLDEAQRNPFIKVIFSCNKTLRTEQKALKFLFVYLLPEKLVQLIKNACRDDLEL